MMETHTLTVGSIHEVTWGAGMNNLLCIEQGETLIELKWRTRTFKATGDVMGFETIEGLRRWVQETHVTNAKHDGLRIKGLKRRGDLEQMLQAVRNELS